MLAKSACFTHAPKARAVVSVNRRSSPVQIRAMNLLSGLFGGDKSPKREGKNDEVLQFARTAKPVTKLAPATAPEGLEMATFAGGCFWGIELAYQRVPGVTQTWVGYTQGQVEGPSYEAVCRGSTGTQYRSGVYYHTDEQKADAEAAYAEVQAQLDAGKYPRRVSGKKVVSELKPAVEFWMAEDYHQQYLAKGGRGGRAQSAEKGCNDPIRCYG
ncbi:hypothetical protein KSW81_001191 [Nannochloris sp. 'desiccata']|nr:hypothetical protein KSW81_001191 [Chlorella desiccata (nom. nud.)]